MATLYPEAYQRLKDMLTELDKISHQLPGKGPEFITDMVKRSEQYGERMFVSPKQLNWVESLYKEHIGALPEGSVAQPYGSSADERRDLLGDRNEIDDDIPF